MRPRAERVEARERIPLFLNDAEGVLDAEAQEPKPIASNGLHVGFAGPNIRTDGLLNHCCGIDHTNYKTKSDNMKKTFVPTAVALSAMPLLTGCVALHNGGGDKKEMGKPTIGHQLIDLKTARDAGAITDAEYQTQKAKLLAGQ